MKRYFPLLFATVVACSAKNSPSGEVVPPVEADTASLALENIYTEVDFNLGSTSDSGAALVDSVSFTDTSGKVTTFVAGDFNKRDFQIRRLVSGSPAFSQADFIEEDSDRNVYRTTDDDVFFITDTKGNTVATWTPVGDTLTAIKILFEKKAGATPASRTEDGNRSYKEELLYDKFDFH